jgi:hypothetical protein
LALIVVEVQLNSIRQQIRGNAQACSHFSSMMWCSEAPIR